MFEHKDVRVRRGRRSASIAGQSNEHDVRSTIASGAMVFGYFLPKQKVARAVGRRGKRQGRRSTFCYNRRARRHATLS